jgi:hypothetical protein
MVFFSVKVFYAGHQKIWIPQNLINLEVFLIEIIQIYFEFKIICAQTDNVQQHYDNTSYETQL